MNFLRRLLRNCLIGIAVILVIALCVMAWLFHGKGSSVPVLNYHQINDTAKNPLTVNVEQFDAQMKFLSENGYHTITPDEMLDAWENGTELPEKPVVITFDDGYVDNFKYAFPVLQKYNLKATIFLISDYLEVYPNYVTWAQAKTMQDSGLINFESHTLNHSKLTELQSTREVQNQLFGSKQAIEFKLNNRVKYIAYPCGSYDQDIIKLTEAAGYRGAFTVNYGWADPKESHYVMDRVPIFGNNEHTLMRFKLRLVFAPVVAPLSRMREALTDGGFTRLASFIPVP